MSDGVTAWRTIATHFRDRITSGELKPGDQLPTEVQMQHVFGVSRTTVRRAVAELSHEGLVEARAPFGVYVIEPKPDLVLGEGDRVRADSEGMLIVTRLDGAVETRPVGTRIVVGA
jgi:GntR family transcriptional regulator, transcriptional repressor for pyruvate dehydrogenase complex